MSVMSAVVVHVVNEQRKVERLFFDVEDSDWKLILIHRAVWRSFRGSFLAQQRACAAPDKAEKR